MPVGDENSTNETKTTSVSNDADDLLSQILKAVNSLTLKMESMEKTADLDPIVELEQELSDENKVTLPIEEFETNDKGIEEEKVIDDEFGEGTNVDEGEGSEEMETNDSLLNLIRKMKPIIANISDGKERKKATDALTSSVRKLQKNSQRNMNIGNNERNTYAKMLDSKNRYVQSVGVKTHSGSTNDKNIGIEIAKSRNPHYKENK